ncbi:MAG: hypothetical protein M1831_002548 [Alyxoria varia]|nr:MAG: hypothetical protein M1831_002548 [Alyxoria varia]
MLEWEVHCLEGVEECLGRAGNGFVMNRDAEEGDGFVVDRDGEVTENDEGEKVKNHIRKPSKIPHKCQFFRDRALPGEGTHSDEHLDFNLIAHRIRLDPGVRAPPPSPNAEDTPQMGIISYALPCLPHTQQPQIQGNQPLNQSRSSLNGPLIQLDGHSLAHSSHQTHQKNPFSCQRPANPNWQPLHRVQEAEEALAEIRQLFYPPVQSRNDMPSQPRVDTSAQTCHPPVSLQQRRVLIQQIARQHNCWEVVRRRMQSRHPASLGPSSPRPAQPQNHRPGQLQSHRPAQPQSDRPSLSLAGLPQPPNLHGVARTTQQAAMLPQSTGRLTQLQHSQLSTQYSRYRDQLSGTRPPGQQGNNNLIQQQILSHKTPVSTQQSDQDNDTESEMVQEED